SPRRACRGRDHPRHRRTWRSSKESLDTSAAVGAPTLSEMRTSRTRARRWPRRRSWLTPVSDPRSAPSMYDVGMEQTSLRLASRRWIWIVPLATSNAGCIFGGCPIDGHRVVTLEEAQQASDGGMVDDGGADGGAGGFASVTPDNCAQICMVALGLGPNNH